MGNPPFITDFKSRDQTTMDLIVEDDIRIGTVRFTMREENIRKKIALPWVSICSDSGLSSAIPDLFDQL